MLDEVLVAQEAKRDVKPPVVHSPFSGSVFGF